jgi:hypothetical protein
MSRRTLAQSSRSKKQSHVTSGRVNEEMTGNVYWQVLSQWLECGGQLTGPVPQGSGIHQVGIPKPPVMSTGGCLAAMPPEARTNQAPKTLFLLEPFGMEPTPREPHV